MSIDKKLAERSGEKCELCSATSNLSAYTVAPGNPKNTDENDFIALNELYLYHDQGLTKTDPLKVENFYSIQNGYTRIFPTTSGKKPSRTILRCDIHPHT